MVPKYESCDLYVEDLSEVFVVLRRNNMRLNPKKFVFVITNFVMMTSVPVAIVASNKYRSFPKDLCNIHQFKLI